MVTELNLLAFLVLAFFSSFGRAQDTGPSCMLNEDGYFISDENMVNPVFHQMNMHYELEYEQDADFDTMLDQLERAMVNDMLTDSQLLYTECHPNSSGERDRNLRNLQQLSLKPSLSILPNDAVAYTQCPERVSPAGTRCQIMKGMMTLFYPYSEEEAYNNNFRHIHTSYDSAVNRAASRGEYSAIDGVSHVKYIGHPYFNQMVAKAEADAAANTENKMGASILLPVIAGSITMGVLLFGTVLFQFRRKTRPENKFQATVRSASNVV
eukprot:CAMPEP_0203698082 /NCGR_PEP_ID=MMETSP0091-20130426/16862_1 /ASSEMBLY_ACC=CAM_ASM_001089 /TAXON_ID=426623 /ORGANISM="Chaetoceros affinis, Strain CCMP159" /LENGTH=266 /DNA_ID=CAMNT_0050570301 /DNA_START=11 /DNA_END=811 /DNA_ORIENTATION=-